MDDEKGSEFFVEVPQLHRTVELKDGTIETRVDIDGPRLTHLLLELEKFREREPLVQALLGAAMNAREWDDAVVNKPLAESIKALRDFKLK